MIDEPQQEIERADEPEPRKEQESEQKVQETVSDEYCTSIFASDLIHRLR